MPNTCKLKDVKDAKPIPFSRQSELSVRVDTRENHYDIVSTKDFEAKFEIVSEDKPKKK